MISVEVTQSTKLGARRTTSTALSKQSYETSDPHLGITSATSTAAPKGSHQQNKMSEIQCDNNGNNKIGVHNNTTITMKAMQ